MIKLIVLLALLLVPQLAHSIGWEGRSEIDNFLTIVACRAEPKTEWKENEIPIPGVAYQVLKFDEHGEMECQRDIVEVVPRHPMESHGGLSDNHKCTMAGMSYGPKWEEEHPGWLVVAVGCPRPVVDSNGELLGYNPVPCPRNLKCFFDKLGI